MRARLIAALEAVTVAAAILAYIWWLRAISFWLWVPIAAVLLVSHLVRGESPSSVGFSAAGLGRAAAVIAPWVAGILAVLLSMALSLDTIQRFTLDRSLGNLAHYIAWGVVQQYLLNGYFFNRLNSAFGGRRACAATALVFSAAHTPNPFLMSVTLGSGYACARFYLKYGNLWVLGVAHGLVGFMLHLVTPPEVSGGFLVGPRYYER